MNTQLLEQPFSAQEIKQREGSFGKMLDYLEGATVINRLNQALDHQWSADVVSHEIVGEEIIVLVRITTEGIVKSQFGSAKIKKNKNTGEPISIGEDYKAATTDAIKKASTLLGVGLHLYMTESQGNQQADNAPSAPPAASTHHQSNRQPSIPSTTNTDNARISNKQLNYIVDLGKEVGLDSKGLDKQALEMFGVRMQYLNRKDASAFIDSLKRKAA